MSKCTVHLKAHISTTYPSKSVGRKRTTKIVLSTELSKNIRTKSTTRQPWFPSTKQRSGDEADTSPSLRGFVLISTWARKLIANGLTGCSTNFDRIFDPINIAICSQMGPCSLLTTSRGFFWRNIAERLFSPIWHVLALRGGSGGMRFDNSRRISQLGRWCQLGTVRLGLVLVWFYLSLMLLPPLRNLENRWVLYLFNSDLQFLRLWCHVWNNLMPDLDLSYAKLRRLPKKT